MNLVPSSPSLSELKEAVRQWWRDGATNLAGALTFFALLSLFPALVVLVALVGLYGGQGTVNGLIDIVGRLGPASGVTALSGPIQDLVSDKTSAKALLSLGILFTLWSASGYVGAFMWAANQIYEVPERRAVWRRLLLRVGIAIAIIALLALVTAGIVVSGPLADAVGNALGLGGTVRLVYGIAKWPLFFLLAVLVFDLLYFLAPNVRRQGWRWVSPGGVLGVGVWLLASAGFSAYVANFPSYDKTYGSLAGIIVFLLWAWIFNLALLLGAEYDAVRQRGRAALCGRVDTASQARDSRRAA